MPDAARPAAESSRPRPGRTAPCGLRQFLSLDRRLPTCQLSPGSDMPSGQSAPPSFLGRHGRTCFDTRRGGPAASLAKLARVRLSGRHVPLSEAQESSVGFNHELPAGGHRLAARKTVSGTTATEPCTKFAAWRKAFRPAEKIAR